MADATVAAVTVAVAVPRRYGAHVSCQCSSWTARTTVSCTVGEDRTIGVGHSGVVRTKQGTWSTEWSDYATGRRLAALVQITYDAPVVTYSVCDVTKRVGAPSNVRCNSAITGGSSIVVNGMNFNDRAPSPMMRVRGEPCATSFWTTATTLTCGVEAGRARLFFEHLGARRRRTPRTRIDLKASKDASHRELSDSTLRFDPALGVRRRHAPKGRQKKIEPH